MSRRGLRIGLAGFAQGYYAVEYTRYLARLKGIDIVGICDLGASPAYVRECAFLTAEDFARELEAPLCHEYEALLAREPDAVLICCETRDHADLAARALEKGIHVFVSKPLAFSPGDLAILRRHRRKGTCLLCGNPLKYEPGAVEFQRRLARGEIGRVYSLRLMVCHRAMTGQEWERDPARSGGNLGTYAPYLFDLPRWFTGGEFKKLYACGDNCNTPENPSHDTVKILASMSGGVQCALELYCGIRHDYPFLRAEAVGTGGTLVTGYDNYSLLLQSEEGARLGKLRTGDMGVGEMDHFLRCIRGEERERCSLADMEAVIICNQKTEKSVNTGLAVTI